MARRQYNVQADGTTVGAEVSERAQWRIRAAGSRRSNSPDAKGARRQLLLPRPLNVSIFDEQQLSRYKKRRQDVQQCKAQREGKSGII